MLRLRFESLANRKSCLETPKAIPPHDMIMSHNFDHPLFLGAGTSLSPLEGQFQVDFRSVCCCFSSAFTWNWPKLNKSRPLADGSVGGLLLKGGMICRWNKSVANKLSSDRSAKHQSLGRVPENSTKKFSKRLEQSQICLGSWHKQSWFWGVWIHVQCSKGGWRAFLLAWAFARNFFLLRRRTLNEKIVSRTRADLSFKSPFPKPLFESGQIQFFHS